jgi:hypothetical protein
MPKASPFLDLGLAMGKKESKQAVVVETASRHPGRRRSKQHAQIRGLGMLSAETFRAA